MDPKFVGGAKKAHPGPAATDNARQLIGWLQRHGLALAIAAALTVALSLGLAVRSARQARLVRDAEQALQAARSTEHLHAVAEDYAATPSGPPALLALAARHFHAGQTEQARAAYRLFIERYPEHFMRPAVDLGLAFCLEAEDAWERALTEFRAFMRAHPDHFLRPQAELGAARSLEQLGHWEQAALAYDAFLAEHEAGGWSQRAQRSLDQVQRVKRMQAQPMQEPEQEQVQREESGAPAE